MRFVQICLVLWLSMALPKTARSEFTLSFNSDDFGISSVKNNVTFFNFDIVVDSVLVAGTTYSDPMLTNVDYQIDGDLRADGSPSGFPGFRLIRNIAGADFYGLSPESTLEFTVSNTADLSDGLQINELDGSGTVFNFNAREFNQNPGRFHPPIFSLDSDGTGRLVNANNDSTFDNPATMDEVHINIADEYDIGLTFSSGLQIVSAVPEPTTAVMLCAMGALVALRRRR